MCPACDGSGKTELLLRRLKSLKTLSFCRRARDNSPMQKRFWAAGAAFFVGLAGMLLWQFLRAGAPFYQGRPLTAWLRQVDYPGNPHTAWRGRMDTFSPSTPKEQEAAEAIRQIGERAVPHLTYMLTNTHSDLRLQAQSLLWRFRIPVPPPRDGSSSALVAFEILGPHAKSAVPPLTQALYGGKLGFAQNCTVANALGAIGPAGWEVLRQALSSTNTDVYCASAVALDHYHVDDPATVLCLMKAATNHPGRTDLFFPMLSRRKSERNGIVLFFIAELNSPSVSTRMAAMKGLGSLGEAGEQVIPFLRSTLQSTNEEEVLTAVWVLAKFGVRAKEVEPALLNMIQESAEGRGKYFLFHLLDPVKGAWNPDMRLHFVKWGWPGVPAAENVVRIRILTSAAALDEIDPNWKNKLPSALATGPTLNDWMALGSGVEPHAEGPTLQQWSLITKGEEPQYQARPLKQWLERRAQMPSGTQPLDLDRAMMTERLVARNAVRSIGTNAIPWLLSWLQSENWIDLRVARRGFMLLDGEARSALRALIELAQGTRQGIRTRAYGCLDCLGLDWDTIWPAILPALHHKDPGVREDAAQFLIDHYPEQAHRVGIDDFIFQKQ